MKKNKKNLSIFKRIGMIALAFCVALGSFFVPVSKTKQNNFASAVSNDSSELGYVFNGSEVLFLEACVNTTTGVAYPRFLYFDVQFQTTLDGSAIWFHCGQYAYEGSSSGVTPFYPYDPLLGDTSAVFARENFDAGYSIDLLRYGTEHFILPIYLKTDSGFIANCKAVHIYTSPDDTYLGSNFNPSSLSFNVNVINIEYIDFNDNSLLIQFLSPSVFSDLYDDRTYYFLNNFDNNEYYQQGFRDGLADNQQNIYNGGFNAGRVSGYNTGFDAGVASANNYSFKSLFGAVIDTPIKAFSGLFNFEFLGVNLFDFFMGILTFGVIVFVIKLLLGGK